LSNSPPPTAPASPPGARIRRARAGSVINAQEIWRQQPHPRGLRGPRGGLRRDRAGVVLTGAERRLGHSADDIKGRELKARARIEAALADVAAARDAVAAAARRRDRLPGRPRRVDGGRARAGFACAVPYCGGGILGEDERPRYRWHAS
jgi:hypothetical protein